jgi:Heat induced stress protein YflT domain
LHYYNKGLSEHNAVAVVYNPYTEAEAAVKELQKSEFDMPTLSLVGKDSYTVEHVIGSYNAGDRMQFWGKLGALWGGWWGLLFGSACFERGGARMALRHMVRYLTILAF